MVAAEPKEASRVIYKRSEGMRVINRSQWGARSYAFCSECTIGKKPCNVQVDVYALETVNASSGEQIALCSAHAYTGFANNPRSKCSPAPRRYKNVHTAGAVARAPWLRCQRFVEMPQSWDNAFKRHGGLKVSDGLLKLV